MSYIKSSDVIWKNFKSNWKVLLIEVKEDQKISTMLFQITKYVHFFAILKNIILFETAYKTSRNPIYMHFNT